MWIQHFDCHFLTKTGLKVTLLTYQPFVCRPQHKQTVVALLQKVHPHYDPALSSDLETNLMTVLTVFHVSVL